MEPLMPPQVPPPMVPSTHMKRVRTAKLLALALTALFAVIVVVNIFLQMQEREQEAWMKKQELLQQGKVPVVTPAQPAEQVLGTSDVFATYHDLAVTVTPKVTPYKVEPGLANVTNRADFVFSTSTQALLEKNAFVVVPAQQAEFFPQYEQQRYEGAPNFVTTDAMVHNYHLVFEYLLKHLEETKLSDAAQALTRQMLAASLADYQTAKGTAWENAAKRNVAFFAVGQQLLFPKVAPPEVVADVVKKEIALIQAHEKIENSPTMNLGASAADLGPTIETNGAELGRDAAKEDYTQYIPRGHYTKTEQLKNYFRAMMWYGRMTFRFKNGDEIRSSALITKNLRKEETQKVWQSIYRPTVFFVGQSDDVTYVQLASLFDTAFGASADTASIISNYEGTVAFQNAVKKIDPPKINSIPIFNAAIQPDRAAEITGFRFMGQRFTVDGQIFQNLVDRDVPSRMLPLGIDVPSALGSKQAIAIVNSMNVPKDYPKYGTQLGKLQKHLAGLGMETWTQNLYWNWIHMLRALVTEKGKGYPLFMQNDAWGKKELQTFMGSWTELKHDTILYAKQVYSEMGGGMFEEKDDRGYVEPNPALYGRLASLLDLTRDGLKGQNLLDADQDELLGKMRDLAVKLKTISEKELTNATLSDDDYELIRTFGGQIEHFWMEANKKEFGNADWHTYLDENPAALVADVATNPGGEVLEEATGYISKIYVIVPVDGKPRVAIGGVYSYYEFPHPMNDRLTDQKWRKMLLDGSAPAQPSWTGSFTGEEATFNASEPAE